MSRLLERLARARDKNATGRLELERAITAAKRVHSWTEIADVLGMPVGTVRWIAGVDKRQTKGEK